MMKPYLVLYAALATVSSISMAAASTDKASNLGNKLTPWGAKKNGNEEGTIPPYTGGLRTTPDNFEPESGKWAAPYKDEKPLFRIDASNVDQYADELSAGQKKLLKEQPDYYMYVYTSHRTAAYPEKFERPPSAMRRSATPPRAAWRLKQNAGSASLFPFPQMAMR